jgi:hypothetical protein
MRGRPSPHPVYVDPATGARMKHCPTCGRERNLDKGEFPTRENPHGTGVQYRCQCRACEAARARRYQAARRGGDAPAPAPPPPPLARWLGDQLRAGRPIERVAKAAGLSVAECVRLVEGSE